MKKVVVSLRALLSAGATALLGALGFSSCAENINNGMAEYGTPTVQYKLKLKVTDQADQPIPGLSLKAIGQSKTSDAEGKALIEGRDTGFYKDHEIVVEVKDIDGDANGVVKDEVKHIAISKSDFTSHQPKGWLNGTVEKEINLKVERK